MSSNNFMSVQLSAVTLPAAATAGRRGDAAGGYSAAAGVADLPWCSGVPGLAPSEEYWYQSYMYSAVLSAA